MILHLPSTFFVLCFSAFGFLTICFHLRTLSFTSDVYASSRDRFPHNSKLADHGEADIIYLVQAQSCLTEHYTSFIKLESRTRRDVLVLSWGKRCHDLSTNLSSVVYIHGKNTSWSSGRNLLYHMALQRNKGYLYYVFLDEDIEFIFTSNMTHDMGYKEGTKHPLEAFENFLLEYEPAVGLCNYCSRCGKLAENGSYYVPALCCSARPATGNLPPILPVTISFDAAVNAFHTKAVKHLLPYRLDYEEISWWESQKYVILRSDILFRGQVIRYTPVTAINNEHRDYPQRPIDNWGNILLDIRKLMPEKYKNQSVFSKNLEVDMIPEISGNFLSTPLWNISIPGPKVPIQPYSHFHK
ncbi:uncharacterized protein LOC111330920 [Stylophora pistillata]|uniref:uncharacterized protein LOC111330920 n=1 Tax=Stylophora pistillata TaxID=50429 RepID=UPI000C044B07|nr:uncharacterized protein LOC111330920 [Stylophora pistillata]